MRKTKVLLEIFEILVYYKHMNKKLKLTKKQEMFCKEYLIDLNATQAAIRAGYSEKTAREIGCENLTKPNVQEYLSKEIEKRSNRLEITADKVLQEIAKLAFSNMEDYMTVASDGTAYVDLSKITRDQAAAISEITSDVYMDGEGEEAVQVKKTKIKLSDKKGNLELLGRYLKLFTDRVEHSGEVVIMPTVEIDGKKLEINVD